MQRTLVNVGEDTTLGDGDVSEKLVQLLVVPDGELEMTGNDTGLLVVAGSVTGQLENLSSEVLEDGSEVDGGTGTDTLSVVALAEKTVDTSHGELESCTAGPGLCLSLDLASLSTARHDEFRGWGELGELKVELMLVQQRTRVE